MGWFVQKPNESISTAKSTTSNPTKDGAFIAPDRRSRAQCWDARDGFFSCLDRNNILDAIKDKETADKVCEKELQDFEKNCASSWVGLDSFLSSF